MLEEGCPKIAGREGGVDANGQSTTLATRTVLETNRDCFRILHDALGRIEEFLAFDSRSRAAVCALEESDA